MPKTEKKNQPAPETPVIPEVLNHEETNAEIPLSGFDMNDFVARPIDSGIVIKRKITTILVRRPNSQMYFQAHPELEVLVDAVDWKDEGTWYLVHQDKVAELFEQTKRIMVYPCVNTKNDPFLFPVPQCDDRGNWNPWHKSASRAVQEARKHWVRIQPNKSIQGYDVLVAEGNLAPPKWPDLTIAQYLSISFQDNIIDTEDHPIVKQLRGMA